MDKKNYKNIIKAVLWFLLFIVCVLVIIWMVRNQVTTGSVFPPILSSVSGDVIKDVKL